MRLALAQISPRLGDVPANLALIESQAARARGEGALAVLFPELALTGYRLRDLVPHVAVRLDRAGPVRDRLAALSLEIPFALGLVEEGPDHRFFNSAAYFEDGRLRSVHRKCYLPTYGLFDEAMDFAPGGRLAGFDTSRGRAGLLICEDLWHPAAVTALAVDGVLSLWVLAASPLRGMGAHAPLASTASVRQLAVTLARFHTTPLVYVNRTGFEDGLGFAGASFAVDAGGELIAQAPDLEPHLLLVTLDPEKTRAARAACPLVRDERPALLARSLWHAQRRRAGEEGR